MNFRKIVASVALIALLNGNLALPVSVWNSLNTAHAMATGPGGVGASLELWLSADVGGTAWTDRSTNGVIATINGDPQLINNSLNFNPTLDFDQVGDWYETSLSINESTIPDIAITAVYVPETTDARSPWGEDNGGFDRFITDIDGGTCNNAVSTGTTCLVVPELFTIGAPHISTVIYDEDATNGSFVYVDGAEEAQFTANHGPEATSNFFVGNIGGTINHPFDGDIAEIIVHSQLLDGGNDRGQIESYLALKYGTTLDPSVGTYKDSTGGDVYDLSADTNYQSNVIGIAYDVASGLDQRISKSGEAGAVLTITTDDATADFTAANGAPRVQLTDGEYVVLATDAGVITSAVTTIDGYTNKIARQWRAEVTNFTGDINTQFDIPAITGRNWDLVQSDTADFTSAGANLTKIADVDASGEALDVTLADGKFYGLLEAEAEAPGGVLDDLALWLKPEAGEGLTTNGSGQVIAWENQASLFTMSSPIDRTSPGADITRDENGLNFHPTVVFNGANTADPLTGFFADVPELDTTRISFAVLEGRGDTAFANAAGFEFNGNIAINTTGELVADSSGAAAPLGVSTEQLPSIVAINYNDLPGNDAVHNSTAPTIVGATGRVNGVESDPVSAQGGPAPATNNNNAPAIFSNVVTIGKRNNGAGANDFRGTISEVVSYADGNNITDTQVGQIESYLALKYGITLDQATSTNYIGSDGTVFWDSAVDTDYNHDIIGLVRDDASGLDQRISKSVNTGAILTIANNDNTKDFTSSNLSTTRAQLNDLQSITVASNGDPVTTQSTELNVVGNDHNVRITREWQMQNPDFLDVNMKFEGFGGYDVIIDRDGDFSAGALVAGTLDANGEASGVFIEDGEYFTLAKFQEYPGGVNAGLGLWYRADIPGVSITDESPLVAWEEQSADVGNFTPTSVSRAPTYESSDVDANFNPYFDFDRGTGSLDRINGPNLGLTGAPDYQMYFVYNQTSLAAGQFPDLWDWDGADQQERIEAFGGNFQGGSIGVPAPLGTWNIGVAGATGGSTSGRVNGFSSAGSGGFFGAFNGNGPVSVGTNGQLDANIAEIIYFDTEDTGTNRQQVESYLALKYGITLDQSTATDYLSSAGTTTVVWDSSVDTDYNHDIAGIGRDDASGLDQRISRSVNDDSLVTVSLENDFTSTNAGRTETHSDDLEFLTWANNDAATDFTATNSSVSVDLTLDRVWQVQEVRDVANSAGNVYIEFELEDLNIPGGTPAASDVFLVIDTDDDFSDATTTITATSVTATSAIFEVPEAMLEDTNFFTLGCNVNTATGAHQAPGGTTSSLNLWLRADDIDSFGLTGSDVDTWTDVASGFVFDSQRTDDPQYVENNGNFNFNPTVDFTSNLTQLVEVSNTLLDFDDDTLSFYAITHGVGDTDGESVFIYGNGDAGSVEANDGIIGLELNASVYADSRGFTIAPTGVNNGTHLSTMVLNGATGNYFFDGEVLPGTISARNRGGNINENDFSIGSFGGGGNPFNGQLSELIVYGDNADTVEQQQIESYLALKYGITLGSATTGYLDSTSNHVYDFEIDETFTFGETRNPAASGTPSGLGGAANTFTLREPATVTITHSGTLVNGNAGIGISTVALPDNANTVANADAFSTSANADRITSSTPTQIHTVLLDAGTYFVGVFSGGGSRATSQTVNIEFDYLYVNDVAGIGRDDASSLDQRISRSVNDDSLVTVSLENDFTSPNIGRTETHSADLEYLTWANNNGVTDFTTTNSPASVDLTLDRTWRVQETGDVANQAGSVYVKIELEDLNIPGGTPAASDVFLVIDTDDDFSDSTTTITATSVTATSAIFEVPEAMLEDMNFFTLGCNVNVVTGAHQAPGGVTGDLNLWLRADQGASQTSGLVDQWQDQSENSAITAQASRAASVDVTLVENSVNFNPGIDFSGNNNARLQGAAPVSEWADELTVYSVVRVDDARGSVGLSGYFSSNTKGLGTVNAAGLSHFIDGSGAGAPGNTSDSLVSQDNFELVTGVYTQNGTQDSFLYVDGFLEDNHTAINIASVPDGNFFIGSRDSNSGRQLDGLISEIIVYGDAHNASPTNRQQIESYLALKYGITLDSSINDYLNSNGDSVYDLTSSYNDDVFGIGRDDLSSLDQQISKSINAGAIVTLSTDSNFTGANGTHTSLDDGQFLVIANNGEAIAPQTTVISSGALVDNAIPGNESGIVTLSSTVLGGIASFTDFASWTADRDGTIDSISWLHQRLITPGSNAQFRITNDNTGDTQTVSFNPGTVISEPVGTTGIANRTFAPITVSTGDTIRIEAADNNGNVWGFGTVSGGDFTWLLDGQTDNPGFTLSGPLDQPVTPIERAWRVENTNLVGEVNLQFDGFDDSWMLLIDTDGNFTTSSVNAGRLSATGETTGIMLSDETFFTLAQVPVSVEFSAGTGTSADETTNDNFAQLLVNGTLISARTIDVDVISGTASTGSDFTFTNPTTITIPAGTYDGTSSTAITIPAPTLTGDFIVEGDETIVLQLSNLTGELVSRDANGDLANTSTFTYTITDDDSAVVNVNVSNNLTSETGPGAAVVTLTLASQPSDDVTINFDILGSADQSEASFAFTGAPLFSTSVTIDPANWNTPTLLLIFGLDDSIDDGNQNVTVVTSGATSPDPNYNLAGSAISDAVIINQDDDVADIVISSSDNQTSESGDTATVTLTPSSTPTGDVVVPVTITDLTEGSVTQSAVTLPAGSTAPVNVAVTGVDDTELDIDVLYQIIFGDPASTGDAAYNALTANDVANQNLVNTDNDDTDNDGVSNLIEDSGPNGGDANGDGVQDSTQSSVSGVLNPVTGTNATIEATGACTFITENLFLAESSLTAEDTSFEYPVGLADFQVQCATPGDSSDITLYYAEELDTSNFTYRKFDGNGNVYSDITSLVTFGTHTYTTGPDAGNTVTTISFTLTDGDPQTDEDGVADGVINDPSGPAIPIASSTFSGSGGATKNYPIGACSKTEKQCIQIFPTQGSSSGSTYTEFVRCVQSGGSKDPFDCSRDWAVANLYQTCNTDNECPVLLEQSSNLLQKAIQGASEKITDLLTTQDTPRPTKSACSTQKFDRFVSQRGTGLPAGVTETDTANPAYKYAVDLAEQRIINGDNADGALRINHLISRAETVKVISNAAQHDMIVASRCLKNYFPDVETGAWYHPFVQNLQERDVVHGYDDGNYRPDRNISASELYKIAAITFGYTTKEAADNSGKDWHEHYRQILLKANVMPGWLLKYSPTQPVTRGDLFALISKILAQQDGIEL